jgi:uncharacterized membrane protein HdeD (DUF308 family)
MSTIMNAPQPSLNAELEQLRGKWGWIVGMGVVLTILGMVALGSVVAATVVSVWTVGVMMIVGGIAEIIHGMAVKTWGKAFMWVVLGALYVLAGIFTFMNPLWASAILTLFLGAALAASGIVRIVMAFQMVEGKIWGVLSGLVTLLLGAMILLKWPESSLYVIGIFLGVDLIFAGASWIGVGLALRRHV